MVRVDSEGPLTVSVGVNREITDSGPITLTSYQSTSGKNTMTTE